MKRKSLRPDILLLGSFLLIGLLLFAVLKLTEKEGAAVQISVEGEVVETFSLQEDRSFTIWGKDGGSNELRIEDRQAYLTEASCPDGLCVNMGRIHLDGESIICLPNQVVITVTDPDKVNGEQELDAVTGGHK